jgi:phospholipase/carboxylesterase
MKTEYLPSVEIEPHGEARASVVWLHGLGADGHDFEPIVPELGLSPDLGVRFVFPHAPAIPVTLNAGFVMPAWYDIRDGDLTTRHDVEGVRRSAEQIRNLVEREVDRGVSPDRIVLAGFSQGGSVALHLGLRYPDRLAGLLALSTYLVKPESLDENRHPANAGLGIFQGHGTLDPMVPIERGEDARERLLAWGYDVAWKDYPMAHGVCAEEVRDIGQWLGTVLGE